MKTWHLHELFSFPVEEVMKQQQMYELWYELWFLGEWRALVYDSNPLGNWASDSRGIMFSLKKMLTYLTCSILRLRLFFQWCSPTWLGPWISILVNQFCILWDDLNCAFHRALVLLRLLSAKQNCKYFILFSQ